MDSLDNRLRDTRARMLETVPHRVTFTPQPLEFESKRNDNLDHLTPMQHLFSASRVPLTFVAIVLILFVVFKSFAGV